jgi:NADH-quinone oxidoreductase subunit K
MLFLVFNCILILTSLLGIIFNFENILILLMGLEFILLILNLNFIYFSVYLDDIYGQIFSLFILTVAAAESAIGLAIIIIYYRVRGNILTLQTTMLKD